MDKSIIIIGAGIAGLSAGCYGQMNGYNTRIFEMGTGQVVYAHRGNARATRLTAVCIG